MYKKRLLLVFTLIIIFVSLFCFWPKKKSITINGTFSYALEFSNYDSSDTFYYNDDYFKESGKKNNKHLTTMSLALAMAVIPSNVNDEAYNINNLLKEIGFNLNDTIYDDIYEETTKDTIGSVITHKKIGDKNLILICLRGEKYGSEWISNMLLGSNVNHYGFDDAAVKIIKRLKDYENKYQLKENKIWITGYSRAGAVANLTGKYLNEHLEEFNIKEDDLYIYTFEAPNTTTDNALYKNIHNIINNNDLVTYVPFKKWGYQNSGQIENITVDKQIVPNSLKIDILSRNIQTVNKTQMLKKDFLEETFDFFANNLDKDFFVQNLQTSLASSIELFYQKKNEEIENIISYFKEVFNHIVSDGDKITNLFLSMLGNQKVTSVITKSMDEVYEKINVSLNQVEYQTLKEFINNFIDYFYPLVLKDFQSDDGRFIHIMTIINNIESIISEHSIVNTWDLLKNNDTYYKKV